MTSDPPVMYTIRTHPPEVGTVVGAIAIVFGELWKRWRATKVHGQCHGRGGGGLVFFWDGGGGDINHKLKRNINLKYLISRENSVNRFM